MVKIYVGNSFNPKAIIIDPQKTVSEVFEEARVPVQAGQIILLNATRLGDLDLDKTLTELNVKEDDVLSISEKLRGNR